MVERHTIETYGRHAWPILLSVLVSPFIPLLPYLHFKGFQSCDVLLSHSPYFCTVQGHTSNLFLRHLHGRRSLRKSRGDKNRFPLDREIVLKIAKNSFTVAIVDKGLCNVSSVRFYQEIMNGHDRS